MDVVKDKQLRAYDRLSRYATFPFYYNTLDNKYIYGTTNYLKNNTPYKIYKIQQNDTLDSIALQNYNDPMYYWIICDFNRIQDPFVDLRVGGYLKLPVISNIEFRD